MPPLSLLIKPAGADCNLACEYCFYLEKGALFTQTSPHRMSGHVLESLIRNYLELEQPIHSFCWQGGEPTLMGLEFFKTVTNLQSRFGRPGTVVANSLQTNCTLLGDDTGQEMAKHFARFSFLVGCSIDGPADIHDLFRHSHAGSPSHEQVLRGLETLRRHQVAVNALTLVSSANINQPGRVFEYLVTNGFDFLQFIPCVEFNRRGKLESYSITGPQWGDFLCEVFDCWNEIGPGRVSIRLFDAIMAKLALDQDMICTFGRDCRQYLVVEHNGDVFPCDFFVERDRKLGNVQTDSLAEIQKGSAFREFGSCKPPTAEPCKTCRYVELCQGGCPIHRSPTGFPSTSGSWLCEGWLQFFDHALPQLEDLARKEMAKRNSPPG